MTETTFELADVERVAGAVDSLCASLDARDRAVLDAVFALAGEAAARGEDVSGYASPEMSWTIRSTEGEGGPGPAPGAFVAFRWGITRPGEWVMLNPQPLPP